MDAADRGVWAAMRHALWPDESAPTHAAEIDEICSSEDAWGFVAETPERGPIGFAEVAIRKYANGCETRPVPFLEGIWVDRQFRRRGIGARMMAHIEAFLVQRGFREIGSDTHIGIRRSQTAHRAWGFIETERVVYFRKALSKPSS